MQFDQLKRREFIRLLGGAAAVPSLFWPPAARAQQPGAASVVGFLSSASPEPFEQFAAALRRGLNQSSYIEGRNLVIEFRWAENHYEWLPAMAGDLVRRQVAMIVASGANPPVAAAKAATSTIPIVFTGSHLILNQCFALGWSKYFCNNICTKADIDQPALPYPILWVHVVVPPWQRK